MAIEYASENESEQPDTGDDSSDTTDIPESIIGDKEVSAGDVIRLEVVSVNEDSETITVKYATPKQPEHGGIDRAVAEFEA